ncbi:MAG: hypothetical protein SGPRY_008558 [Prymnesium sp.]
MEVGAGVAEKRMQEVGRAARGDSGRKARLEIADEVSCESSCPSSRKKSDSLSSGSPSALRSLTTTRDVMVTRFREVMLQSAGTFKVPLANKAGAEPVGICATIAFELHAGLHEALRMDSSFSVSGSHEARSCRSTGSSSTRRLTWWRRSSEASHHHPETDATVETLEPELFRRIRAACKVDEANFCASIGLQPGRSRSNMTIIGGGDAAGKSGAFFFLSPDQIYIFKSTRQSEARLLRSMLPAYAAHMEANPGSILPRYLGLFQLKGTRTLTFLCMTNAFAGVSAVRLRFDLKGSTHKRKASKREKAKPAPVFKDLDWLEAHHKLPLDDTFLDKLEVDVGFLANETLIDYSLLVGMADGQLSERRLSERAPGLVRLDAPDSVLYIALVDVLTSYTWRKVLEHHLTGTLFGCRDISCQPPHHYAQRFMRFIREVSEAKPSV